MRLDMDYHDATLWDVIARIPGRTSPARVVVAGNHRDAWTYGAVDPNSGTATLLELARSFGALLKTGWRPDRTIELCSWDGEEYGLMGSTEWVEDHDADLTAGAVAYINVDSGVSGADLGGSAVPSLAGVLTAAARDVSEPRRGGSGYDTWLARETHEKHDAGEADAED